MCKTLGLLVVVLVLIVATQSVHAQRDVRTMHSKLERATYGWEKCGPYVSKSRGQSEKTIVALETQSRILFFDSTLIRLQVSEMANVPTVTVMEDMRSKSSADVILTMPSEEDARAIKSCLPHTRGP